jgi:K+-transporting ATPase ATPase B chain
MAEKLSLWNPAIMRQAAVDSVRKLDPRAMVKNPVMLVVEIGSVLTTVLLIQGILSHQGAGAFNLQITLWLWFTVLFANFAEAMAEGRGKAQADTLRKAKGETMAIRLKRFRPGRGFERCPACGRHHLCRSRPLYPRRRRSD